MTLHTSESLTYTVTHVFLPVQLPNETDYSLENDLSLARAVLVATHAYTMHIDGNSRPPWYHVTRMLENLLASIQSERLERDHVVAQLREMHAGDVLAFLMRPHNFGIILTKQENSMLLEAFEVSPQKHAIEDACGPLQRSYPEFAVEVPKAVLDNSDKFPFKLADFLCSFMFDDVENQLTLAQYVSHLVSDIQSVFPAATRPIIKHIRDDVGIHSGNLAWRRSSVWLFIKIAIQMSVDRSFLGRISYKASLLLFICTVADDANVATLSTDLLHLMACKILRRLAKLGPSVPDWLSQTALKTCAGLREILDTRWMPLNSRPSPFHNPSQKELERDTQLSLEHSREYISNALASCNHKPSGFHPNHRPRGTIDDFLSSKKAFFEGAYRADHDVALYDVEIAVEEGIDDWTARVEDVGQACTQLALLMHNYMEKTSYRNPEDVSVKLLTGIELFIALDKLVMKEIPMLADYSPEVSPAALQKLYLHKKTSLHRLSCAYQYISSRQSRSRQGWSVLSGELIKDSLPVRYYDQSPDLQQLKARIEKNAAVDCWNGPSEDGLHSSARLHTENSGIFQSPLPSSPLHAKVVVFELQCPGYIRSWRFAVALLWYHFHYNPLHLAREEEDNLLSRAFPLQRYFANFVISHHFQIHFVYFHSAGFQHKPTFRYAVQYDSKLWVWEVNEYMGDWWNSPVILRYSPGYVVKISHTPNAVLADQADCPGDLSLDEFLAFGQLRSGGTLQWFNILLGLRSRTLSLRRNDVKLLVTCAVSQVGPLDSNTGAWIWHKELEASSFCNAILDELVLIMDFRAQMIDAVLMMGISLMLTRILASSPSKEVSERTIILLRSVRKKTFNWIQELSYSQAKLPRNEERRDLLLEMAAACRSTFDVDSTDLSKLFPSAQDDVGAALLSSLIICEIGSESMSPRQDHRLSITLERTLSDVIIGDVSDYSIDLAICKFSPSHKPAATRWAQLEYPNARWLVCQTTSATYGGLSQMVHLNLINGELRVDGQPIGKLRRAIRSSWRCKQIFADECLFILSEISSTTLSTVPGHKVYFSLRGDNLLVRTQCHYSKETYEWIPPNILEEDLPTALVDEHIHWLNLSSGVIDIRPLEQPWHQSTENWKIDCRPGKYRGYRGCETLVDMRSPTWSMMSQCFKCPYSFTGSQLKCLKVFVKKNFLLVTIRPIEFVPSIPVLRLSALLTRHQLSFFVNKQGELESCDFKDMVYDENQCVGAFLGLDGFFVLRQKIHLPEELVPRCILVLNPGFPKQFGARPFYLYNVDSELGCLRGDGSLINTMRLASMHAAASWHRPDPLTEKTGAQAALCLLRTAECRSFMKQRSSDFADDLASTKYPQINIVYQNMQDRLKQINYWATKEATFVDQWPWDDARNRRAASRATHLFTSEYHAWTSQTFLADSVSTIPLSMSNDWISLMQHGTLLDILSDRTAPELPPRSMLCHNTNRDSAPPESNGYLELNQLFTSLEMNTTSARTHSSLRQEYVARLGVSAHHVLKEGRATSTLTLMPGNDHIHTLKEHYLQCRATYLNALTTIKHALGPSNDSREQVQYQFGQWSPVTGDSLVRCLASRSRALVPQLWKKCLVSFALLLLDVQRARRLLRLALDGVEEEFSNELGNDVCDGWNPEDYPDWLLIQIQGNFLIRRTQAEAAMEIISPKSGQNTVMQVNMGEGKSSVIIPIAAVVLANGKQLARVVVPKALTFQMFDILVSRLGGLVDRPVYHLPFSRFPEYNNEGVAIGLQVDDLNRLTKQCMAEHGILLMQPEHIASLKLMCVGQQIHGNRMMAGLSLKSLHERVGTSLLPKLRRKGSFIQDGVLRQLIQSTDRTSRKATSTHHNPDDATKWLDLLKWMDSHVRDIIDESDDILHSRFQLVYTVGTDQYLDGHPGRWTITQQVLLILNDCVRTLARSYSNSTEIECGPPGSFPYLGIAQGSNIGRRLTPLVLEHVMAGRIPNFDFRHVSQELQDAIRSFLSHENVLPITVKRVEDYAKHSGQSNTWSGLLLLRGLLAFNVLFFTLTERRWRVDYGLAPDAEEVSRSSRTPTTTMLAVPYRAKDTPAPKTQFGHPDITIILTCLSYYYSGLTKEQLRRSFQILLDEDDPFAEYALWVKDYDSKSLSGSLRTLGEINVRSSEQWDNTIFSLFYRNQATINFYLSRVVFPKEAKEFPWKFSASSWDLAERRAKLITGFSGTSDSRWLLPMSIIQRDLDHERGTNARVLAHLLRPENEFYLVIHQNGKRDTTHEFLRATAAQRPEIRVLLDVGAQILDLSNFQVAEAWLSIARDVAGAVYFDETDQLRVLMRNGISAPLSSSSFYQNLDRCVVYLDHEHTRGTDIKLPHGSRAAVTLGPKLTKDRLLQGCMRMRKLGRGHAVMFFVPPEVDLSIRTLNGKRDRNAKITTADIICWTIYETWIDIEQRVPYWAKQGMDHKSRHDAWTSFSNNNLTPEKLSEVWLQPARKSLEELYAPCETHLVHTDIPTLNPGIQQRCDYFGILSLPTGQMEEEQEREVSREREREREVDSLPPKAQQTRHVLSPDVVAFVKTGFISLLHSNAFHPVFTTLERSTAASGEADVWSSSVLATTDFCKTIKPESTKGTIDQYFRPVQWVLSRTTKDLDPLLVLVSPFEASQLLPDISESEHVHIHLYAPRTSKRMKPCDDLKLYSIPPLPLDWTPPWNLTDQLNVFAGQLYLRDYQSYLRLCHFLGVPTEKSPGDTAIRWNEFTIPGSSEENENRFLGSPLSTVIALLSMRNRGKPFGHTHMGKILHGQVLTEKDFEELPVFESAPPSPADMD